jgi:hypothetical protein
MGVDMRFRDSKACTNLTETLVKNEISRNVDKFLLARIILSQFFIPALLVSAWSYGVFFGKGMSDTYYITVLYKLFFTSESANTRE